MGATAVGSKSAGTRIDRRTAQVAEENFFERLGTAVDRERAVPCPLDGRTYDLSPDRRRTRLLDGRTDELKTAIKRHVERDLLKTYDEMPKCGTMLFEVIRKEFLGSRDVRVVIAGASVAPVEEFLRDGASSAPMGPEALARVRDEVVSAEDVFYFLCVFAATSWSPEARNTLSGRNYLAALCERYEDAWRVWYAPDERWGFGARLFDLTTYEEKIESILTFVERHTFELLMDELTEEYVFDHLGYALGVIREAFELASRRSEFLRLESGAEPWRLVRVYA